MSFSKGGRGVSRHTWGLRTYAEPKAPAKRNPRCTGTTRLEARLYWVEDADGREQLKWDAKCTNCGAVYFGHLAQDLTRCIVGCGLEINRAPLEVH